MGNQDVVISCAELSDFLLTTVSCGLSFIVSFSGMNKKYAKGMQTIFVGMGGAVILALCGCRTDSLQESTAMGQNAREADSVDIAADNLAPVKDPKKLFGLLRKVHERDFLDALDGEIDSSERLWLMQSLLAVYPESGISASAKYNVLTITEEPLIRLAGSDPLAALRLCKEVLVPENRNRLEELVFSSVADRDPQKALDLLLASPDFENSTTLFSLVFKSWARSNPEEAIGVARKLEDFRMRKNAVRAVFESWADKSAESLLKWADGEDRITGRERDLAFKAALPELAEDNAAEAIKYCNSLNVFERNKWLPDVLGNISKSDPLKVAEWLESDGNFFVKKKVLEEMGAIIARAAPEIIIRLSVDDVVVRREALREAIYQLATEDIEASVMELDNWRDFRIYRQLVTSVAEAYGRVDLEGALEWAGGLHPDNRAYAVSKVINTASDLDSERAFGMLNDLELEADDLAYKIVAKAVVGKSAMQDPESAAALVDQLPPVLQETTVGEVVKVWPGVDPVAASEWISDLPSGRVRDSATLELLRGLRSEDPEMAMHWASSLTDIGLREREMRRVVRRWLYIDSDVAREKLRSFDASEDVKRMIHQFLEETDQEAGNSK